MTPARRRRLIKIILVVAFALTAGVLSRFLFLGQNLPSLLLGRKPGASAPGTVLVKETPNLSSNQIQQTSVNSVPPQEAENLTSSREKPLKLKYDVLTNWTYEEGKTPIPDNVKALEGKYIEITGFMMPINETENITKFIIVNSLWGCCFGQSPAVNHVIIVSMEPGKAVDFYPDPVKITGKFSVGETREEGYLVSIFQMEAFKVVVK